MKGGGIHQKKRKIFEKKKFTEQAKEKNC